MRPLSAKLLNYTGGNPFNESQARGVSDEKLVGEFYPTSIFLSLFNQQHEILLGTRGSGKTVLLKMLSYSCMRGIDDNRVKEHVKKKSFIGFYIPLHLEFMAALRKHSCPDEQGREFFQFAFNCSAAKSLLSEIVSLLNDCISDVRERLITESKVVQHLVYMWLPDRKLEITSIKDLQWEIDAIYFRQAFWMDGQLQQLPPLAGSLLAPIQIVVSKVSEDLGLDPDATSWIACIDEAEFLRDPYIECINTFMRSEKRPLAIKMATLPFKHTTKRTMIPGLSIQPNGNDFSYRNVDMDSESNDFEGFTNHICMMRLKKCELQVNSLEQFIGKEGLDHGLDYYRREMGEKEASEDQILQGILDSISNQRKQRYELIQNNPEQVATQYFRKFSPVYYVRRMKDISGNANRKVGWFAGPRMLRRISDGNPRRFIQLMSELVQKATETRLDPKTQHTVIMAFCERQLEAAQGLPEYGPLIKEIVETVGRLLEERVHGNPMIDGGSSFRMDDSLLAIDSFQKAIQLAIDYSHIFCENEMSEKISTDAVLRLANMYAVCFWLPMRKVNSFLVRSTNLQMGSPDITPTTSKLLTSGLQLKMLEEE